MWKIIKDVVSVSKNSLSLLNRDLFRENDHFFYKATHDESFRYYQNWCSDWRIALVNITTYLNNKDLKGAESYFQEILKTRIPSIIYFHIYLEALEKEVREKAPFLLQKKNPFEQMRQQFRKMLRKNKTLATQYFQQEVIYQLTELMAQQTTAHQLLVKLHYYQALVSPSIYHSVIAQIKQFIGTNSQTSTLYPIFYTENGSSSDQYQRLFSNLHTIFKPQPSSQTPRATRKTTRSSKNKLFSMLSLMPLLTLVTAARATATSNSTSGQFDLSAIDGTNGFYAPGLEPSDTAGWALATGDINDDGIPDLIIGIDQASPNDINQAGMVCVIFGSYGSFSEVFDLSKRDGTNSFCIDGIASQDQFGYSVVSGDVTGDGIDDVIVSAPFASSSTYKKCGTVYVFEGGSGPFAATMSASSAKAMINGVNNYNGNTNYAGLGGALSIADINNDGVKDIIMGATGVSYGGDHAGAVYVALGSTSLMGVFSVTAFNGSNGFMIAGAIAAGYAGMSVGACDVNQDGILDIIIGAYGLSSSTGAPQAGVIFMVFGGPTVFVSLGSLANKGWTMYGTIAYGQLGQAQSLSCADVNNDGYVELIASAREADVSGEKDAGVTYILPGKKNYYSATFDVSAAIAISGNANTLSGWAVTTGYINNDTYSDVLISTYTGETYIWYGSADYSGPTQLNQITNTTGFIITWNANDSNEMSLATGDLNGDNKTDICIGYPWASNNGEEKAGSAYVIFNTSISLPPQNSNSSSYSSSYMGGNEGGYNNIIIIVSIAVGGLTLVTAIGTAIFCARKRSTIPSTPKEPSELTSILQSQPNYGTYSFNGIKYDEKEENFLGKGTYGKVYKGTYKGEIVAIKVMKSHDPKVFSKYEDEVDIMKHAIHRNIIAFRYSTYQRCLDGDYYYIVMDYASHHSLRQYLNDHPQEVLKQCKRYALEIAQGLNYLHERNIIHRDLKCANVVLDHNYQVKICDFGLSAKINESYFTSSGSVVGTYAWMDPQLFQGKKHCTMDTDIYSYGVILWEIVTSKDPSKGNYGKPLPTKECPVQYAALMSKCWDQRNPRPTAQAIIEELNTINDNRNYLTNSQSISGFDNELIGNSQSLHQPSHSS